MQSTGVGMGPGLKRACLMRTGGVADAGINHVKSITDQREENGMGGGAEKSWPGTPSWQTSPNKENTRISDASSASSVCLRPWRLSVQAKTYSYWSLFFQSLPCLQL